jgi:hypothetical protein
MAFGASALAQQNAPPSGDAAKPAVREDGLPADFPTVEAIMKQAVNNIAARYSLNEEQHRYTDDLMKREVLRFLREHHDEVWPVIRDLIGAQFGGRPPEDKAKVMQIGGKALPLMKHVEDAILRANQEWRSVLTEDQKAMHDFDLGQMQKTFVEIETNFRSWAQGTPRDGGIFPPPRVMQNEPPRPRRPAPGLPTPTKVSEEAVVQPMTPPMFDKWVEEFIKQYELDEAQKDSARSILREQKTLAQRHLDLNREEHNRLKTAQEQAARQRDHKALEAIDAKLKTLLDPINQYFVEMERRLRALLTTAQIERHDKKKQQPAAQKPAEPSPKRQTPKEKPAPEPNTNANTSGDTTPTAASGGSTGGGAAPPPPPPE